MKKKKVLSIIILLILFSTFFNINISNAALQSNDGTKKAYTISEWLKNIRKMEASGGTFGLNAEIDENTLLDKGASNGLDVHMEKNTEYGALAILSASSYGNPDSISDRGTTTGNSTGVVIQNAELVSAIASDVTYSENINKIDNRYRNLYIKDSDGKFKYFKGDAMKETEGWHNSTFQDIRLFLTRGGYVQVSWGGAYVYSNIFTAYNSFVGSWWDALGEGSSAYSRAVVVVGEGL